MHEQGHLSCSRGYDPVQEAFEQDAEPVLLPLSALALGLALHGHRLPRRRHPALHTGKVGSKIQGLTFSSVQFIETGSICDIKFKIQRFFKVNLGCLMSEWFTGLSLSFDFPRRREINISRLILIFPDDLMDYF